MVSISRRRSRSESRKTRAAVATVAAATKSIAATTNPWIVKIVSSRSFMTATGSTI